MIDLSGSIQEQREGQNAEGLCKTVNDLARYRKIIADTRPDAIVECGTCSGRSALWFAREAGCPVFTIDVSPGQVDHNTRMEARQAGVRFWAGSSTDGATVAAVHAWAAGRQRIMVVLDSDHSAPHVLHEMEAYAGLVTPGCYMVVEDGIIRWIPFQWDYYRGGPLDAIDVWRLHHGDAWRPDMDLEDMLPTTQFPSGWLRRLR